MRPSSHRAVTRRHQQPEADVDGHQSHSHQAQIGREIEDAHPSCLGLRAEGVADGDAIALDFAAAEFLVVINEEDVHLRADKEMSHRIETQAGSEVSHKVIAALVVRTSSDLAAADIPRIETDALSSNAPLKFGDHRFDQRRRPYRIEIVKQRPVVDDIEVRSLSGAPGDFAAHSEVLQEQEVGAESWGNSSTDGDWRVVRARI